MKELTEKRAQIVSDMETMLNACKSETRAMTDDEQKAFEDMTKAIADIDKTLEAFKKAQAEETTNEEPATQDAESTEEEKEDMNTEDRATLEMRAFAEVIRGTYDNNAELRADINMTKTDNGVVIPSSIANKIIAKVKDLSPIFERATRYNVKGTFNIPYYDESTQEITMAYADEFAELESTSGKFTSVQLGGFLAGALTKVSKSLVNNSDFDIVNFVVTKMAEAVRDWYENELLNGTSGKIEGLTGVTQVVTAASASAVTVDELMETQDEVPDVYQANAFWIMNRATRGAIRKLKDNDGNYLLNRDVTSKWGYTLLGKDVYCSDKMAEMATGKTAVYYGDMSGLALKMVEDISVQVLIEKFATQHAIGVVAWTEADAKVENAQKISALKMA